MKTFGTAISTSFPVTVQGGFPEKPLKIGEGWSTPLDYNLSLLDLGSSRITGTLFYRLKSVEIVSIGGRGYTAAIIDFYTREGKIEIAFFGENLTAEFQMYGQMLIDVERGWQVGQEINMSYQMQVMGLESRVKALITSRLVGHEIPP